LARFFLRNMKFTFIALAILVLYWASRYVVKRIPTEGKKNRFWPRNSPCTILRRFFPKCVCTVIDHTNNVWKIRDFSLRETATVFCWFFFSGCGSPFAFSHCPQERASKYLHSLEYIHTTPNSFFFPPILMVALLLTQPSLFW
jgi:hypothetical protein